MLFFQSAQSADATADHHTNLIFIDRFHIETGIDQSHACSGHCQLHITVRTAAVFGIIEKGCGVKILHFSCDVGRVATGIHRSDTINATAAGFHGFPSRGQIITYRTDAADSSYHNASFVHKEVGFLFPTFPIHSHIATQAQLSGNMRLFSQRERWHLRPQWGQSRSFSRPRSSHVVRQRSQTNRERRPRRSAL